MATMRTKPLPRRVAGVAMASCRRFAWGRTLSQGVRLRRPWRYLAWALLRPSVAQRYEVRATGVQVLLRHDTSDISTFDEVFCSSVYEPPDAIACALQGLGRPLRILDLGANVGLFSAFAIGRWPGAHITAFEPDPDNLGSLRAIAALNRARGRIEIVDAAAGATAGTARFVPGLAAESHMAHPDEDRPSIDVDVLDVLEHIAGADLVKIDIEGGEWALLGDARMALAGTRAIVLEHHGRHSPGGDARSAARRLLSTAGYEVLDRGPAVDNVGMLWAWRA